MNDLSPLTSLCSEPWIRVWISDGREVSPDIVTRFPSFTSTVTAGDSLIVPMLSSTVDEAGVGKKDVLVDWKKESIVRFAAA